MTQIVYIVDVHVRNEAGEEHAGRFATWDEPDPDLYKAIATSERVSCEIDVEAIPVPDGTGAISDFIRQAATPAPMITPDPVRTAINELTRSQIKHERAIADMKSGIAEILAKLTQPNAYQAASTAMVDGARTHADLSKPRSRNAAPIAAEIFDDEPADVEPVGTPEELQKRDEAARRGFPLAGPVSPRHTATEPRPTGRRDRIGATPEMTSGRMQVIGPSAGSVILRASDEKDEEGNAGKIVTVKPRTVGQSLTLGTLNES